MATFEAHVPEQTLLGVNTRRPAYVRKQNYIDTFDTCLRNYRRIILFKIDNVPTQLLQDLRQNLRDKGKFLLGKNSLIKKAIQTSSNEQYDTLLPHIHGKIGFFFTNEQDLEILAQTLIEKRIYCEAKPGLIAQADLYLPKGSTGLGPGMTNFFRAVGISTRITKGKIDVLKDTLLVRQGEKITESAAKLLGLLDLRPFEYGLKLEAICDDGAVYSPGIYEDMRMALQQGIRNMLAVVDGIDFEEEALEKYRSLFIPSTALKIPRSRDCGDDEQDLGVVDSDEDADLALDFFASGDESDSDEGLGGGLFDESDDDASSDEGGMLSMFGNDDSDD